jgi:sugar phosphate isomerase/epimerase
LQPSTRRRFLSQVAATAAAAAFPSGVVRALSVDLDAIASGTERAAGSSSPAINFPTAAHDRIAIATYPFRDVIAGLDDAPNAPANKMDLKDFPAHIAAKLGISKIEPWSRHFRSTDAKYLHELRAALDQAHGGIVDIAADGEHSQYSADSGERDQAVAFGKKWIDVAVAVGSPSVRTNIPQAKDSKPDVGRAAETMRRVAEYAASRTIVVHLENDNPVSEDPFFIVQVVEKANSPWLHALPDFANSLTTGDEDHAYKGIDAMFAHAYGICHIKAMESNDAGKVFRVDMAKTFAMLKARNYKGYCSMEFDSPGDPYAGTQELITTTLKYLS